MCPLTQLKGEYGNSGGKSWPMHAPNIAPSMAIQAAIQGRVWQFRGQFMGNYWELGPQFGNSHIRQGAENRETEQFTTPAVCFHKIKQCLRWKGKRFLCNPERMGSRILPETMGFRSLPLTPLLKIYPSTRLLRKDIDKSPSCPKAKRSCL